MNCFIVSRKDYDLERNKKNISTTL